MPAQFPPLKPYIGAIVNIGGESSADRVHLTGKTGEKFTGTVVAPGELGVPEGTPVEVSPGICTVVDD